MSKLQTEDGRGKRGRPRDPAVDEAVLAIALRQLARRGYDGLSIEGVAREAGVSKPTIYRRWPSKAELAAAVIGRMRIDPRPAPSDSPRRDLIAQLQVMRTTFQRPQYAAIVGMVMLEEHRAPQLLALFRERIVRPQRVHLRAALERAATAGEIAMDADLDVAVNLMVGSFLARHLSGDGLSEDWAERVVSVVLAGLAPVDGHGAPESN